MSSHSWGLQSGTYAVLDGAAIAGVTRITDHKITDPANIDFPFIEIGEAQFVPDDTVTSNGGEEFLDLHVWSRYSGQKEVKEIMGAIHSALHQTALTVSGLSSCFAYVENARVLDDPDGLTKHGVVTVRFFYNE